MKTEAILLLMIIGVSACGLFAIILSPWWLVGFFWFGFIGYMTANKPEQEAEDVR